MDTVTHATDVCIAGGGPAGLVSALLLLQAGHRVTVLERHANFDREYRGEVLMPRFMQTFKALGLLDYVQSQPHLKLETMRMHYKSRQIAELHIGKMVPEMPYAMWMPQPVLLEALHKKASEYHNYKIFFGANATELLGSKDDVKGLAAQWDGKRLEVPAKITIGCDGRFSTLLRAAEFQYEYQQHEFDVVWFSVKCPKNYEKTLHAFFSPRHNYLILPKYPDLLQCGLIVRPGEFSKFIRQGIDSLRNEILNAHEVMHPFARQLKDFDPFFVLQARVHLLKKWARDGLLLIGDAAHTCSPAGAVGVSVAVESAVVAAEVVSEALQAGNYSKERLSEVQVRREGDVRRIHKIQRLIARRLFAMPPAWAWLAAATLFVATRLPILPKFFRRLAALPQGPNIRSEFKF